VGRPHESEVQCVGKQGRRSHLQLLLLKSWLIGDLNFAGRSAGCSSSSSSRRVAVPGLLSVPTVKSHSPVACMRRSLVTASQLTAIIECDFV